MPLQNFSLNIGDGTAGALIGTVGINQGGTGQVTAQTALDALLPSQTAKSGYVLTSNGTNGGWSAPWDKSGTLAAMNAASGDFNGQRWWNTTYLSMFQWVTDRWWPIGPPDPRYGFMLFDDFNGVDRIGCLDWQSPGSAPPIAANLLNTGLYNITTSTASAQNNLRLELDAVQLGTMDLYWETLISVPALATAGEDFCLSIGLNDSASYNANGTCTDGAWISLNRAVNAAKWIYNTCSNTTATNTNSNTTAVAATFYRLGSYVNAGTSFTGYVNGVSLGTAISTNLPTGAGRQTGFIYKVDKSVGTGASAVQIDYFWMYGFYNGQRVA